jgi:hypothetical protein
MTQNRLNELDPLILDLCEWVAKEPRLYTDVMEAWRTSCPRLTVWEDAVERGVVQRVKRRDAWMVELTEAGQRFLGAHDRIPELVG